MPDNDDEKPGRRHGRHGNLPPLVAYRHNLLAALVGALAGLVYAVIAGSDEYLDPILGGALIAQVLLGGVALVMRRRSGSR